MKNTILLDEKFTTLVVNNQKTGTTRPGRRDYDLGKAILETTSQRMEVNIESITYKILKDITKEELLQDGFETLEDLMNKALLIYYPDLSIEDEVTIIKFKYIKPYLD